MKISIFIIFCNKGVVTQTVENTGIFLNTDAMQHAVRWYNLVRYNIIPVNLARVESDKRVMQ